MTFLASDVGSPSMAGEFTATPSPVKGSSPPLTTSTMGRSCWRANSKSRSS
jgi:hypothetical protein